MKARFSVLVAVAVVILSVLTYVTWLISDQILYKQQAQPINFPHTLHAGNRAIACQYCHRGTHAGYSAGVPSVQECWDCHRAIPELLKDPAKHPEIAKLKEYWVGEKRGGTLANPKPEPIQWWKVYELPDHVHFPHEVHIAKGFDCAECHGNVKTMDVVHPAQDIGMGFCISCHRGHNSLNATAPTQCSTCHY
jgi:hypothetical protein